MVRKSLRGGANGNGGLMLYPGGQLGTTGSPNTSLQDPETMIYCTNANQCQKYSAEDIQSELNRRGVAVKSGTTKPYLIKALLASNRGYVAQIKAASAGPSGFRGGFPSSKTNPAMYFMTWRDFVSGASGSTSGRTFNVGPRGSGWQVKFPDTMSKSSYEKLMKGDKTYNPASDGASVSTAYATAHPTETVRDALMTAISEFTGLIKPEYLTIDHEGLVMNNIQGAKYKVFYNPITDEGEWYKVAGSRWADVPDGMKLKGMFRLGKDGLPIISQLTYYPHHLKVFKRKDGKLMQVRCMKKNKDGGEEESNCKKDKRGRVRLQWLPYDPTVKMLSSTSTEKFTTPLGVFSFDQLMTMPLDKIVQMLVILKIAEGAERGDYASKLEKYGVKFDPSTGQLISEKEYVPAMEAFGAKRIAPVRETTRLPDWFLRAEDKLYSDIGASTGKIKKACYGRKPVRCPIDSYAPGVCSPNAKLCYNPRLQDSYTGTDIANTVESLEVPSKDAGGAPGMIFKNAITALKLGRDPLSDKQVDDLLADYGLDEMGNLMYKGK